MTTTTRSPWCWRARVDRHLAVGVGRRGDRPIHDSDDVVVPRWLRTPRRGRRRSGRAARAARRTAPALRDAAGGARTDAGTVAATAAVEDLRASGEAGRDAARAARRRPAAAAERRAAPAAHAHRRPARRRSTARRRALGRAGLHRRGETAAVLEDGARSDRESSSMPDDAPLGLAYLVSVVDLGDIVGTEFGRVVPNFVAQQRPIRDAGTLRDEVSRRGLTPRQSELGLGGPRHRPPGLHARHPRRSRTTRAISPRSAASSAAWTSSIASSSAMRSRRRESPNRVSSPTETLNHPSNVIMLDDLKAAVRSSRPPRRSPPWRSSS